jgi:archaellum component FlaC
MTDYKPDANGWEQWSKYVLKELERINETYSKLDSKIDEVRERMNILHNERFEKLDGKINVLQANLTMLHIKVAGIGAVSSLITTIVVLLLSGYLKR